MVEAVPQQHRNGVTYAKFRTDKKAEPGFTQELYNVETDPKYYDNLEA